MIKHYSLFIFYFSIAFISCKRERKDFALSWTQDIKQKIIADANQPFDSSRFDSTYFNLTFYKGKMKLKNFALRPHYDSSGNIASLDTLISIFYSADQNFKLVRELCPASDRSFEAIDYKNVGHVGLVEFRFCNGKIKESGFKYGNRRIGIWETYDSAGKVIDKKNNGDIELLDKLKDIRYRN